MGVRFPHGGPNFLNLKLKEYKMIKSVSTTYEFSKEEIKNTIAKELNVKPENTEIYFLEREVGDDRFGPTHKEVVGVRFVVKN